MKPKNIMYVDTPGLITYEKEIEVTDGEPTFVSFIADQPPRIYGSHRSKVWQVMRCYARYSHSGSWEHITPENSAYFFCHFYDIPIKDGKCLLYKRVRRDYTDYFSGKYSYAIGSIVTALDWDCNPLIVCGRALHLAPTIDLSAQWNEDGRLLLCEVDLKDMSVFPYNISQVRCRSVLVLQEE